MYKAYQLSQNDCMDGCCELCNNCINIQIKKYLENTKLMEEYNDSK